MISNINRLSDVTVFPLILLTQENASDANYAYPLLYFLYGDMLLLLLFACHSTVANAAVALVRRG